MTRILITAPLRQEPKIFCEYQESLDRLRIPDGCEVDRFFVVNDCPEVIPYIRGAEYVVRDNGNEYRKTGNDHLWSLENMLRMGDLRNETIQRALAWNYDAWFSVDTDLVVHPDTLETLIKADKDIVSEIFWTRAPSGRYWCNAWDCDQSSGFLQEWKTPGLYRCGMTGALTLVKRHVLEAGVSYERIPNIMQALRGEDRHFCVRAACLGFEMWIDSHCPARHLYTEDEYNKWMEVKAHAGGGETGAKSDRG